jgi:RNA polymerase sigma factor (sigma-70 family)
MIDYQELRKQFISGNLNGLKEIYCQYRNDVTNVLMSKYCFSEQQAEEYFSQSLLVFYEKVLDDCQLSISSIKNYIIGICVNKVKLEYKYKSKFAQKANEVRVIMYEYQTYDCNSDYRQNLKDLCKKSLSQLDKKCNTIISSFYLDGMSMKEISSAIGLSSSNVAKTLKSRCFKKLLNLIKNLQSERVAN